MSKARNKQGQYILTNNPQKDAKNRIEDAKKEHGFGNLNKVGDYLDEMNAELRKNGLLPAKKEVKGPYGFALDFYKFLGAGRPRDYLHPIKKGPAKKYDMLKSNPSYMRKRGDMKEDSHAPFFTPIDDMYGTPSGYDTWYDQGRIPVSHLMAAASKRLGALYRACNGTAHDVLDNRFEFVKSNDIDKEVKNANIDTIWGWMRRTRFLRRCVEMIDYDNRSGLGHLMVEKYIKEEQNYKIWSKNKPGTKPERFWSFSSYFMTPNNSYQTNVMDYDKQRWNFTGGLSGASDIHHSRVYVSELRREELGMRGLALAETCWVACMCYLNLEYYILKSLSQLGTVTVGVVVDQEYPTPAIVSKYLTVLNAMRANDFYVLGRGAQLKIDNAAGKLGSGIKEFMEFLKEEMSAAFIIPKNQFFGRSEGGGLDGAGAVVSKEDYLGSNISTKQLMLTDEIMYILSELCNFSGLDDITIKFNIDLLKTKEQQLKEQMMEEQLEQTKVITKQTQLGQRLFEKQAKLQMEMSEVQLKMLKENPEQFMQTSDKDEENLEEKKIKKDMYNFNRAKLELLKLQYSENSKLINWLNSNTKEISTIKAQDEVAWHKIIKNTYGN